MIGGPEVARFRQLLATRLGWGFADNDLGQLATVLTRRTGMCGVDDGAYLARLGAGPWSDELTALAEDLTVTETYFFRHNEQFRALREVALPERAAVQAVHKSVRLLSVGCSSGEEAYTLAIVAREVLGDPSWVVSVLGLDVNPAVLRKAAAASYSGWSLRETPDDIRERWFRPHDGRYDLDPEIKAGVRFRQYNVADEDPALWRPEQYDVVFCRNLLMYLNPHTQAALITRVTEALAPGGFLFLGHTDSLGSRPPGLEPMHSHHTFYYRRPVAAAPVVLPASAARRRVLTPAIRHDLYERAKGLLAAERFGAALDVVEAGLSDHPQARDQLLQGVLLAHAGRVPGAETVARRLLETDGLYADAHHLLAVCLEDGTSAEAAIGQYRLAAYLDAGFAMPRLRLGLLARRRGDHRAAGPELDRALLLLWDESDERIALFGGGFGRIALTTLCRSELDAIGVRR
jgi:chemotaxis protein methyltransferase CheR